MGLTSIYGDLRSAVDKIVANYKAANADGKLTFTEIFTLVGNAVATFVQLMERVPSFGSSTGAEKKAAVLLAIDQLFDEVIIPIDIKGIPNLLEGIADRALKQLVMILADGGIDSIVNIFNKTGWGTPDRAPYVDPETPQGETPQGENPQSENPSTLGLPPGFEAY
jgi:hypothetical protein